MEVRENELTRTEQFLAAADGLRIDHAEEEGRLRGDDTRCAGATWHPERYCEKCGDLYHINTLQPATDPISGIEYTLVCQKCRDRIAEVGKAEAMLAHRDEIELLLNLAIQRLELLGQTPMDTWPHTVARVWDQLHTLRGIYLRKVV